MNTQRTARIKSYLRSAILVSIVAAGFSVYSFSPDPAKALVPLLCIFISFATLNILITWYLVFNYYSPADLSVWIGWLFNLMANGIVIIIVFEALTGDRSVNNPVGWSIAFGAILFFWLSSLYALARERSDRLLVIFSYPPGIQIGAGVLLLIKSMVIRSDGMTFLMASFLSFMVAIVAFAQIAPLLAGYRYLIRHGLLGKIPVDIYCLKCNYNLTGSIGAERLNCPECGSAIPVRQRRILVSSKEERNQN